MAKEDVASQPRRGCDRSRIELLQAWDDRVERETRLARGCEHRRHVEMRTDANARRRVARADVREEKEQQQRTSTREDVGEDAAVGVVTTIDVPAGVSRIDLARETDGESAQARTRHPSPNADEAIERSVQTVRVRRFDEAGVAGVAKPDDRSRPRRAVATIDVEPTP